MEIKQSLGYLLNISARMIKRKLDLELKNYGITTAQWAVLKLLAEENNLSQAEIADKLNADRATSGTVIDKLILKGLLHKELFENDHRSYQVKIMPSAYNIVQEVSLLAENVNLTAMQGLSETEMTVFAQCINKIIANLEE